MAMKQRCTNLDPDSGHRSRWAAPDMVRLYVRETVAPVERNEKPKRRWAAVGWLCPKCKAVIWEEDTDG